MSDASEDSDSDYASEYASDEEEQLKRSKAKEKADAAAGAEGGGDEGMDGGDSAGAGPSSGAGVKPGATQLTESTAPISAIDKRMLEELLLVVQNLGTVDEAGIFIRGPECLNWLQDLQQVLARDDSDRRHVSNFIGSWNVVPKKLVPLLKDSKHEQGLILTMLKIFFMLTKQISRSAAKDAAHFISPKTGEVNRKNMQERKKNADEQLANLQAHKACFADPELLSILVDAMQTAVSFTGSSRTEEHSLTIELVLALVRNVLAIPDAVNRDANGNAGVSSNMQEKVICAMQEELMLDVILMLAEDIDARENKPLNLVIMEILYHLTAGQNPLNVAKHMNKAPPDRSDSTANEDGEVASTDSVQQSATENDGLSTSSSSSSSSTVAKGSRLPSGGAKAGGLSLKQQLLIEKSNQSAGLTSRTRHSHFGGVLWMDASGRKGKDGDSGDAQSQLKGSVAFVTNPYQKDPMASLKKPMIRRDRKKLPFNANNAAMPAPRKFSEANRRAEVALAAFLDEFLREAYQAFMKNIKGEFRRESSRLSLDEDRVVFFRLTRFFLAVRRHSRPNSPTPVPDAAEKDVPAAPSVDTNLVSASMDLFSFNLVYAAIDQLVAEKKYRALEYTCELMLEMTHMLWHMRANSVDLNGQMRRIAVGLMTQIFFAQDPKDRLHFLVRSWQPATFSKQFLENVVELIYMTYKVLDLRSRADDLELDKHVEAELKAAGVFDMFSYVKKMATADVVEAHRTLLEYFAINDRRHNHYCVSFYRRLCTTELRDESTEEGDFAPTGAKKAAESSGDEKKPSVFVATFEPLLYNIPILSLCDKVLNAPCVNGLETRANFADLRTFCETIVRHFAKLAAGNSVLFVDALFMQPALQRMKFCETAHLHYCEPEQLEALKAQRRHGRGDGDGIAFDEVSGAQEMYDSTTLVENSPIGTRRTVQTRSSMSASKVADDDVEQGKSEQAENEKEEEDPERWGEEMDFEDEVLAVAVKKKSKKSKAAKSSSNEGSRGAKWSDEDDQLLRVEHQKYRDSLSMLETLAELEQFKEKKRTTVQIEKRIRHLRLHFSHEASDGDEDSGEREDNDLEDEDAEVEQAADEDEQVPEGQMQVDNEEEADARDDDSGEDSPLAKNITPDKADELEHDGSSAVTPDGALAASETSLDTGVTSPSDESPVVDKQSAEGSSLSTAMDVNDGEDEEDLQLLKLQKKRKKPKKAKAGKRLIKKAKVAEADVEAAPVSQVVGDLVDSDNE